MRIKRFWIACVLSCFFYLATAETPPEICNANQGLELLNQPKPDLPQIRHLLTLCDAQTPNDAQVLLLHGLLARKEGLTHKKFQPAIHWLEKSTAAATPDNTSPALELAVTYEWNLEANKAKNLYQQVLSQNPNSRPALLGIARVANTQNQFDKASKIYTEFLQKNPKDIDALNGLARVKLSKKEFTSAKQDFEKVQTINPGNADATIGLKQIASALSAQKAQQSAPDFPCPVMEGLTIVNEPHGSLKIVNEILDQCDRYAPNTMQVLLLHGLLGRKEGLITQDYRSAITWFQKAADVAPQDPAPELELAVTYEWAGEPKKAQAIYEKILARDPNSRPALLGMARVNLAQYHIDDAIKIYESLLRENPYDVDVLNGLGQVTLANKQFTTATYYFETAQTLQPNNEDARIGLQLVSNATKYRLDVLGGFATVSNLNSYSGALHFFDDLNATDQLRIFYTHNSSELQLGLITDPTLLPKNSYFIGFQRQIPERYGWDVTYDYRQRDNMPVENRMSLSANLYLVKQLQWFGGVFESLPAPNNNQLYYSGFNYLTKIPVNFSLIGYWGEQQLNGTNYSSSAYSLDFSKEFPNRAFYDAGVAYSPSQMNWNLHGRFVLPITKNQAIEAGYDHYFFNGSTYIVSGWRIYW